MLLKVYQWVATMIVVRWAVEEDNNLPSCTHYTKGTFPATNITDATVCRTACATAEGLPVGDFTEMEHHIYCTCTSEPDHEGNVPEIRELCADAGAAAVKNVTITPTPAPFVTDPPATTPPTAAPSTAAPTTTTAPPTTSSPPTAAPSSGGRAAAVVPHGLPVAVVAVAAVVTTLL